jgi:hypothetical protein
VAARGWAATVCCHQSFELKFAAAAGVAARLALSLAPFIARSVQPQAFESGGFFMVDLDEANPIFRAPPVSGQPGMSQAARLAMACALSMPWLTDANFTMAARSTIPMSLPARDGDRLIVQAVQAIPACARQPRSISAR